MSRFNLIDEPWLSVVVNQKGETQLVSLKELFENAHNYQNLAGDTQTQDFAVLRLLLAILHTVFSRFDAQGHPYDYFELDEKYKPTSPQIEDEDDLEDYANALMQTWEDLWKVGKFPETINDYLEKWYSRFYLLDERYPFFQVTHDDLYTRDITVLGRKHKAPTNISAKKINGLITESGDIRKNKDYKPALFSPKYDFNENKNNITYSELARWIITYQGYSNTSDKADFTENKNDKSFGWLYTLGGIYLTGENLFETLMLNTILLHPDDETILIHQRPSWEYSGKTIIENSIKGRQPDNLSELYTDWGRAIYINPTFNKTSPLTSIDVVKLSKIDVRYKFNEPMTIWHYNKSGDYKNTFTPKKHQANQSLWRSFGMVSLPTSYSSYQRQPVIIDWLRTISPIIGSYDITLQAVSLEDDNNPTSRVPVDEITDSLSINELILTDIKDSGWVPRINDTVDETKIIIESTFKILILDIKEIRKKKSNMFVNEEIEKLYFQLNQPFSLWLASLRPEDSKDDRIFEWRRILKEILLNHAKSLIQQVGSRDYTGIVDKNGRTKNIATIYNRFVYFVNKHLKDY